MMREVLEGLKAEEAGCDRKRKGVHFLLVPNNQFKNLGPEGNSDIKAFAKRYVNLTDGCGCDGGNVTMLAKSQLSPMMGDFVVGEDGKCSYHSSFDDANVQVVNPDACLPSSKECCDENDDVYGLLQETSSFKINWNFDVLVVTSSAEDKSPDVEIIRGLDFMDPDKDLVATVRNKINEKRNGGSFVERAEGSSIRDGVRLVGVSYNGETWDEAMSQTLQSGAQHVPDSYTRFSP